MIRGDLYYIVCVIGLVASAVIIRRHDPDATPTSLFDRMMADRPTRIAILVMWWWLGWHLLGETTFVA